MKYTRAHKKSVARSYRRHRATSKCRGKGPAACRGTVGCSLASGKKRSFCRTRKNTRTHRNQKGGNIGMIARRSLDHNRGSAATSSGSNDLYYKYASTLYTINDITDKIIQISQDIEIEEQFNEYERKVNEYKTEMEKQQVKPERRRKAEVKFEEAEAKFKEAKESYDEMAILNENVQNIQAEAKAKAGEDAGHNVLYILKKKIQDMQTPAKDQGAKTKTSAKKAIGLATTAIKLAKPGKFFGLFGGSKTGGFLTGALTASRQALLPVLMYKAQKHQQKRVRSHTQKRKSRR